MQPILTLANDRLAVAIYPDFSGIFKDLKNGLEWSMSNTCYQEIGRLSDHAVWNRQGRCYMDRYPSFFTARDLGEGALQVSVLDPLKEIRGTFTCRVELAGEWIRFRLENIDESLPSLIFPPSLRCDSLVVPTGIGEWHRQPIGESRYHMPAAGFSMRWFGGLRGEHGWMGVIEDGYADTGLYLTGFNASPGWQKTMGRWAGTRSVTIGFTNGGYVGMAKRFRSFAQAHGLHRTLREKAAETPAVASLIGGRCLSFFQAYTRHPEVARLWMRESNAEDVAKAGQIEVIIPHRDVKTVIAEAKALGMKRGYFNLRGWLKGGYDEMHPDVFPPEPALGSEDELREIMAEQDPFVALLHDNYQDIYPQAPSFPKYVQRTPDGRLKPGGTWHGGRCYILNSPKSHEYVRRNWETYQTYRPRGSFLDTISGAHFQEDYSPEHPMTRTEDAEAKLGIVQFFKSKGLLVGSEIGSDFGGAWVDFIENRHQRKDGFTIPLWPLVYHDAMVTLRYASGTHDFHAAPHAEDLLWGYAKLWPVGDLANWRSQAQAFRDSFIVDEWHARIGWEEMTDHRYLNAEGTVERTVFAPGLAVVGNFSSETVEVEGRVIAPGQTAFYG